MPTLPPVTMDTLPVKSKSGAMLKLLVLTLPAVAPTIPHRSGSSPPVICAQAGQVSIHPAKLGTAYRCCARLVVPPYWRGSLRYAVPVRSTGAQHFVGDKAWLTSIF